MKTKIKSVYIASPYSPCTQLQKLPVVADLVRRARFHRINLIEAHLTDMTGYAFVCPITQSHTLARYVKFDEGFASWKDIDFKHIRDCDEVWVIMMKDWDKSIGVQAEIKYAKRLKKPLRYLPDDIEDIRYELKLQGEIE